MTERPFNGDQEAIFKQFEERVVDDLSGTPKVIEFFTKHPTAARIAAGVGVGLTLTGGMPVAAAENPSAIIYEQPGDINQKYDDALNRVLAMANSETSTSKEVVQSPLATKLLIQTGSPYCEVTNSITGDVGVLKKTDSSVSMVNGRNMVPIRWAEYLGYEVAWNGTTKTATITNDEKKVSLTLGSKIMTVEETGKETKKVTMDVATQTDKNGRTVIPIGYFGKDAMGVDVQWDGKTKTIGVNYTTDEFAKVVKTEVLNKELKYQALQYVCGGEFMNASEFVNPLEKLSVGATVVYSSEKNKATEKKDVLQYQSKIKKGDTVYCVGGKSYLVRPVAEHLVTEKDEKFYQLSDMKEVKFPTGEYFPSIRVDYKKGNLVATDLMRVTYDYSSSSKKFVEKSSYELLGNPSQRIRKSLNKFLTARDETYDKSTGTRVYLKNPLSLDEKEVKEYCNTGSDEKCKSFKVINYSNGDPALFVAMSEQSGVGEKTLTSINEAVNRFNEIDPEILHLICDRNGMDCVAFDKLGFNQGALVNKPYWAATYNNYSFGGIVFLNKNWIGFTDPSSNDGYRRIIAAENLFVESRGLRFRQHMLETGGLSPMDDILSNKPGIVNEEADKYRFFIKNIGPWLTEKKLTRLEYNEWFCGSENMIVTYDPSYQRTWTQLNESNFIPEK